MLDKLDFIKEINIDGQIFIFTNELKENIRLILENENLDMEVQLCQAVAE